ncbi:Asp-tRNA(Asn)/Glu-tRNA(Gln) amidotransferase subunit GatB [Fervidobacterium pennivorans subsp. shakshaketiis]|uniref:Asp-tRNA(Asn)/Glu-tRNA(Gln) amidotransferase subunit GatB n=1 Tax=Fervidobacterium TaxID=2422 RepID=UPI001436AEF0|nr:MULTISPECIES: Asp-tRNA(Asn)/Glu-tRNA(Gln) amidotransferase subunit GatB [Fervidobacterium]MDM7320817.1 Asp-tRNA(Asn)/Glu-tRNA(Gln) amidotransferase subunit GatB [Fervidobacterium sp.]NPU89469.1 Asp-tRNA(Asn)/Glu-tRNA(Gln) amidotransferase subunit GatB [Fervidobacterium sp.]QIV79003.1 Asp-tRNA(Asn)/Glu-tRNA(Gln) amidotransferase subunit GatB [Fervidobacterium pennivorans subsp. keratinolyticus]
MEKAKRYKPVIGLEIHVQLSTKTKAFCNCSADVFDLEPNTSICPVCTGQPGALPVPSMEMFELGVRLGLALNCKINRYSRFDRKNYFYPDLPKGYQITQFFYPLAEHGFLEVEGKRVRIRRIHLEEDAGKLMHAGDNITEADYSLVDMNRCGVPLAEIVTEPDIESPEQARIFMEKLRSILRYIGVSSGDMEKGAMRCDANISVVDTLTGKQSNKVEVKNMNSFRFVEKALEYEYERIVEHLEKGLDVERETRGWNLSTKTTVSMRSKEEAHDYRYFPEPDIPPVVLDDEFIEKIKATIGELPEQRLKRFVETYGLNTKEAWALVEDKEIGDLYEEAVKKSGEPKEVANWFLTELFRLYGEYEKEKLFVSADTFVEVINLMKDGTISRNMAKDVFQESLLTGKMPKQIVEEKGLKQIDDTALIEQIAKKVIESHPKEVETFKAGKEGLFGFFVGQVMKELKGKANPKTVNEILNKLLRN